MKDIQNQPDTRRISIKKVGVKNITYPITVRDKERTTQKTVGTVNMYVNLPHHFKGTHMSRFVEILNRFHGEINLRSFHRILGEMKGRLQAEEAHMEIEFPYFLKRRRSKGGFVLREYLCAMHGCLGADDDLILGVQIPIWPPRLPPRGDAMPQSQGHWGVVHLNVRFRHFMWIEDLIDLVESVTSGATLSTGERPVDSGNELSVENLTQRIGHALQQTEKVRWFAVTVRNLSEGGNPFASLEWPELPSA